MDKCSSKNQQGHQQGSLAAHATTQKEKQNLQDDNNDTTRSNDFDNNQLNVSEDQQLDSLIEQASTDKDTTDTTGPNDVVHNQFNMLTDQQLDSLGDAFIVEENDMNGPNHLGSANSDHLEIPREEIRLIDTLTNGTFVKVHLGYWKNSIMVAVKEPVNKDIPSEEYIAEATIMKKCEHPQIVTLYGICTVDRPIYIIQEFMSEGSLLSWLEKHEETAVKLKVLLHIAYQIALGMEHLEKLTIIHRDLSARNILLDEKNNVKISNFYMARLTNGDDYLESANTKLPIKWTALEGIMNGIFSIKTDVWSYGILLMELFTFGEAPYSGMSSYETITQLEQGYRMPKPENYYLPDEIYQKMLECWDTDPHKRPSFCTLVDFLKSYEIQSEIQYKENAFTYEEIVNMREDLDINQIDEIPREEIRLTDALGHGFFGNVHLGYWKNNIKVAIREWVNEDMPSEEFIAETTIMKKCEHPQIVVLYGVCIVDRSIYVIQEYMSHGSLHRWLKKNKEIGVKLKDLLHIAYQIALGMEHLQKLNIIHRDLTTRNILLGENNIAKICNFYLARLTNGDDYLECSTVKLPVKWTAPEALLKGIFSVKSDVWSYGILLMEMCTYGEIPYSGMSSNDVLVKLDEGYRMPKPDNYNLPDEIYHIMLECWDSDPQNRPSFSTLVELTKSYVVQSEIQYNENAFTYEEIKKLRQDLETNKLDEIPREEIRLTDTLGYGFFGEVHRGYWKNNIKVAVKKLVNEDLPHENFIAEAIIMKKCEHPQIVALYGVCTVDNPIYIIQEYMSQGSLLPWLKKKEETGVKLKDLLHIAHQIALGMAHLEKLSIIHRYLSAKYILLGEHNIAKICNFHGASLTKGNDYQVTLKTKLPIKWTALEGLMQGILTVKSNVWSYGIVLMEIFTYGQEPYHGMTPRETIDKLNQGYRMPKPENYNLPDEIYQHILDCWAADPKKRPSFCTLADLLESYPVLTEIQYKEVVAPENIN